MGCGEGGPLTTPSPIVAVHLAELNIILPKCRVTGLSLTPKILAADSRYPAITSPASTPCSAGTLKPRRPVRSGFQSADEISYRGVKLPRLSAAPGRFELRRGGELP
jgi:hypothetical protein